MLAVEQIELAWAAHRSYLVDLAFRMLGDIGRAEDVVQEAFARLSQTEVDAIADQKGWLIVVTSRLCLDEIGSARVQREVSAAGSDFDLHPDGGSVDPADRVTHDDSLQLALLVVLERLSPAERVAYVLHDIFQLPFDTIGEAVGRPAATCRQLARRARRKLESRDGVSPGVVTAKEHREVTERFIGACANGNIEELLEILDPEVSGGVDLLPGYVVTGAARVARNILTYWGRHPSLVSLPIAGEQCLLAFSDRELSALLVLAVRGERITEIHVHADPDKLRFLKLRLGG